MSRTPRRPTQVLPSRRVNNLTLRPVRQAGTVRITCLREIGPINRKSVGYVPIEIGPRIILHAKVIEHVNDFEEMRNTLPRQNHGSRADPVKDRERGYNRLGFV